jgi:thiol peroxidase
MFMMEDQMTGILIRSLMALWFVFVMGSVAGISAGAPGGEGQPNFKIGDRLPDAGLIGSGSTPVRLADAKGRVRLISIVPQLNTPVCDEQTHHFSEQNGRLDKTVEIVTISTNTWDDQAAFARKARISNITFLSDAPSYEFGKRSGLLLPPHKILHRSVIVSDADNIIRYMQLVPMGELPNFDAALEAARRIAVGNKP